MGTRPISATLQESTLDEISSQVGPRGVSAYLEAAAREKLARDRRRETILDYIAALEREDPSTPQEIAKGEQLAAEIVASHESAAAT